MLDATEAARARMVDRQIAGRGIRDAAVLAAMRAVPRHRFVPAAHVADAYADHPLPIGHGVTISQPYIVALMSELARVQPGARVLEIGTGCGYQTAVLLELGAEVYSVEVVPELAERAAATLAGLGRRDVHLRTGDGYLGWPERAPFAAILVAAAAPRVPAPLREQLAPGGRLVIPVGQGVQDLCVIERDEHGALHEQRVLAVQFVPMIGAAQREP